MLKELGVKYRHQEVEAQVVIGDEGSLAFEVMPKTIGCAEKKSAANLRRFM